MPIPLDYINQVARSASCYLSVAVGAQLPRDASSHLRNPRRNGPRKSAQIKCIFHRKLVDELPWKSAVFQVSCNWPCPDVAIDPLSF